MSLPDERELIEQITAGVASRANRAGFDSDCAIVPFGDEEIALNVDAFAEATHFPDGLGPEGIGHLAAGATLADLAAAGADVVGVLAAYGLPPEGDRSTVLAIAEAVSERVEKAGGELLGGDTKPRGELTLTVTALGVCPLDEAMLRSQARPGDRVLVTGPLGGAGAALVRIREGLDPDAADPLIPPDRAQAGQLLREAGVACAMDLSDGLADAAVAIAEASDLEVRLEADAIPLHAWARDHPDGLGHALSTGGDYELTACVSEERLEQVNSELEAAGLEPAVVGEVHEGSGAWLEEDGDATELERGYQHRFDDGSR